MFPGRIGGSETYVRGLLGAFEAGFGPDRATVLASSRSEVAARSFESDTVSVEVVDTYWPGDSDPTRLLAMMAARVSPRRIARGVPEGLDLIHFPVTVPIPSLPGIPRVVSLADVQHHDMPELFSPAERAYRRWAYDRAAQDADQVVTISSFSAERIADRLGIPRERISAIHHGIDHSRFNPSGPQSTIPGLPHRYVYYPANAWPHKNHERLIAAFSEVADPDLWLVLSGSLHKPLNGNGHPRVLHLGHVPADQVAGLYRAAAAVIFPSLYEGFGFPPIEAMACGCPVAASDIGAVAEVCDDAALLFDPDDRDAITRAISAVSSDHALRAQLREKGLAHASRFTWKSAAERHVEVYRKALDRAT